MPTPAFPVFVSSTWEDLTPERAAVKEAVLRMRQTQFVGMEHFGSRDETTRRASLDEVDRSEIYVGIIAARYGSGITEAEYRRARSKGLYCLIYFKDDSTIPPELRETDPAKVTKLDALKAELRHEHTVTTFDNPHDLAAKLTADLHRRLFDNYLPAKLESALRNELPRADAQALLEGVKDLKALGRDLLARLDRAGFNVAIGGDYVGRDKNIYIQSAADLAVAALHQLPPPPADFTGRLRELAELTAQIERGGATISGLQGLGGVGKTALALKLAQHLTPRYPDAQFYLDLKGVSQQPLSPAEALAHVIRAYHPTAKLPEGETELRAQYLSVLHGRRALVLMDNAAGPEQVAPLVPPESCVLLVTSRRHFTLPGLHALSLDALPPADAHELLLKIAPRIGDHADEIAELCGRLPLALRLAASALAERPDLTPADYARRLSDAKTRLSLVEASLALSYDLLTPEQQTLWRHLSVFPAPFDARAAAAVWQLEPDPAQDRLGDLLKYSLLDWDDTLSRYRLHDLARLFASSRLTDDERITALLRHAAHYLKILGECGTLYLEGEESVKNSLALFDMERRNIEAGQKFASQLANEHEVAARLCNAYGGITQHVLGLRQHPRERITWLQAALAAARKLNDRHTEGMHLGHMGLVYDALGDIHRAIELYEQDLVIAREISDRSGECATLINLGVAHCKLGEVHHGMTFFEQGLVIARELGDRRSEASVIGNMGVAYGLLSEVSRSIEFYEQNLAIAREIGDRWGVSNALGNLGNVYSDLGEVERAIEFYEQTLAIAREIGDRIVEGHTLFNIALALNKLGNRAQAIAKAEAALEIYEQIESPMTEQARKLLAELRGEV